jgi:hypothetical protein
VQGGAEPVHDEVSGVQDRDDLLVAAGLQRSTAPGVRRGALHRHVRNADRFAGVLVDRGRHDLDRGLVGGRSRFG